MFDLAAFRGEQLRAVSLDSTEQHTCLSSVTFSPFGAASDVGSVFPALLHNLVCLLRVSTASKLWLASNLRTVLHGGFSAQVQTIINMRALSARLNSHLGDRKQPSRLVFYLFIFLNTHKLKD